MRINTTTNKRYIVAVIEVDARDYRGAVIEDRDLTEAVEARLDEFYPVNGDHLSPGGLRVHAVDETALDIFLSAADVGLMGLYDTDSDSEDHHGMDDLDVIHADQLLSALRNKEA